ncbi:hypothetical protein M3Y97_00534600 [Aphelenchoides bicaudatus]|nr:hypothetical protein M3Y97_00534600 [Aphelenchoides bicaudatus]
MRVWLIAALLVVSTATIQADWWDDFVDSVSNKLHEGAEYVKTKAGPTVREKFDSAKEKLQDPETHAEAQTWLLENIWNPAKKFVVEDVAPELKKVYEAAVEGNEKRKEREGQSQNDKDLNRVWTENYGVSVVNQEDIKALTNIPTSNVAVECFVEYEPISKEVKIQEVIGVSANNMSDVAKADWNLKKNNVLEGDVLEKKPVSNAIPTCVAAKKVFITGLTSGFCPELFSYTVLLASHTKRYHSIGRAAECNLVYNEVLRAYVVFTMNPIQSAKYSAMVDRKPDSVEGIFYVDLDLDKGAHGFYAHEFFRLIADPFGYLDLARFAVGADDLKYSKRSFRVPIKDRLSKTNDQQTIQDLDLITRFEITSSGDDAAQNEIIENLRGKEACLAGGGIVINSSKGLVYAQNFSNVIFRLCDEHGYKNGDPILFKAIRIDMVSHPTFLITMHKRKDTKDERFCDYEDGKFKFKARFDKSLNCYEAIHVFGYVPCKVPPPDQELKISKDGSLIERIYEIRADENTSVPRQTILCHGVYLREL